MGTKKSPTSGAMGRGVDGRRAWRDRNRNAVVDALLDFYEEDDARPGAQAIAERSGVSRRSLFRYFDDMDELCRAAIARHSERVRHLFEIKGLGEGQLEDRVERLVDQRARLFEAISPVRRIARLHAPTQPIIAEELARSGVLLRRQIERHFEPELSKLSASERRDTVAALDVLMSFEAFDLMRTAQGLSRARARDAIRRALRSLLA